MRQSPQPSDQEIRKQAVDTSISCIVQAPAGSGKTTLLVDRYLNLLGKVNYPEEILAITFTRKAAREMRERVLSAINSEEPEAQAALKRDQARKWDIKLNPQRLKIQTIDSFVNGIVHRLPYQSQLNLELQPANKPDLIFEEAAKEVLQVIERDPKSLGPSISRALAVLDNSHSRAVGLIAAMLNSRQHWIEIIVRLFDKQRENRQDDFLTEIMKTRERYIQTRCEHLEQSIGSSTWQDMKELNQVAASNLEDIDLENLSPVEYFKSICNTFWTKNGDKPRARFTKREGFPPYETEAKERAKEVAEKLEMLGIESTVKSVIRLPVSDIDEDTRQVIRDFGELLLLVTAELTRKFEASGVVDFTEMAIGAQRALDDSNGPSELALALDYRISHILVDEFQDTSIAQSRLLDSLTSGWVPNDGNTFFAVGDPQQSIYMFRQANMQNFLSAFDHGLNNRKLIPLRLEQNFRSSPDLVNWVNSAFVHIFGPHTDPELGAVAFAESIPYQSMPGEIRFKLLENPHTKIAPDRMVLEAMEVADDIHDLLQRVDKDETIVLLATTRSYLDLFLEHLRRKGINYQGVEIQKLSQVPLIQDLFALTAVVLDRMDKIHWYSLLLSPLVGLTLDELESINSTLTDEEDLLTQLGQMAFDPPTSNRVKRLLNALESAYDEDHRTLKSTMERLWYRLGGPHAYKDNQVAENSKRFFGFIGEASENTLEIGDVQEWIESQYASEVNPEAQVEVMTIHKAKGLEWDYVFLPKLTTMMNVDDEKLIHAEMSKEGVLFSVKRMDQPDQMHVAITKDQRDKLLNEYKRLLYVAVTRAKKGLFLYASQQQQAEGASGRTRGSGGANTFLYFLRKAGVEPTEQKTIDLPEPDAVEQTRTWKRIPASFEFSSEVELPNYDRTVLARSTYQDTEQELPERKDSLSNIGVTTSSEIGNLLHQELHRMCRLGDLTTPSSQVTERWRNRLVRQGFTGSDVNQVLDTVSEQLNRVLNDPEGRWILDNSHAESESEVSFSTYSDNQSTSRRIDRTFIDEDGTRWIIDYKSTAVTENWEVELEKLAEQHAAQLERYANIFKQLEDHPIQTALYVTSRPKLVLVHEF